MSRSEVHLFILWERARHAEARILADISSRFAILDLVEVTWSPDVFTSNLVRFYGSELPPDSDKERECGTGPFVVAVVDVRRPRRRLRHAGRGWTWVTETTVDARARYRRWTGDGYRVHASGSVGEAERDLVLLFGRRSVEFLESRSGAASIRRHRADLIGTHGWTDVDELLLALEVTSGFRITNDRDDADLALTVDDLWWAERVVGGRDLGAGVREIVVRLLPYRVALSERRR